MNRILLTVLAAAGLLAAQASQAITADEIIAKNLAARGGLERLQAIHSLKRTGRAVIPGANIQLTVTEVRERPGLMRQEATLQGLTQVVAWDGHEGWTIQPFGGRKDPERLSADDAKPLALAADIDFPFVNYKATGARVEYLGLEDVDGTPAHKLRLDLASGDTVTYYVDPDTWMVIRDVQKRMVRGAEQVAETDYGDYERVEGVWVPMTEATGPKGTDPARKFQLVYERAEANVAVDPSYFAFPAAK